ncbi:MAG: DUF4349 domain-containing protein [Patescibacteria group bacterium]
MKENIVVGFLKRNKITLTNTFAAIGVGAIVLLLISYLFGASSTNNMMRSGSGFGGDGVLSAPMMAGTPSYEKMMEQDFSDSNSSPRSAGPSAVAIDRKIIKNGSLSLLVEKAEDAVSVITKIAENAGGFVENATISDSNNCVYQRYSQPCTQQAVKSGNITIRVPADKFEDSFASIRTLAIKVESENNNSRDVSAEFTDQQAKLKNMKAEEVQYQEIMKRAVKIEDVLSVTKQLTDVRGRIDVLQGQINYLSRQVDMSTISVDLRSEANIGSVGNEWRPVSVAKQALKDMLTLLTEYVNGIIVFIIHIPIYLLHVLAWLVYFFFWVFGLYLIWQVLKYFKTRFID